MCEDKPVSIGKQHCKFEKFHSFIHFKAGSMTHKTQRTEDRQEYSIYTPCPDKKGATDFFAVSFTNIDGFS